MHSDSLEQSTILVPIIKPPTPAPSPGLTFKELPSTNAPSTFSKQHFALMSSEQRRAFLASILADCTPSELLFISSTVTPLLKRDFLRELPPELACYILSYIEEPRTLTRASRVSRYWNQLISDEWLWKRLCYMHGFEVESDWSSSSSSSSEPPLPVYRPHFKREFIAGQSSLHHNPQFKPIAIK